MRRRRTKPQTKQGKRPTKTTPEDTETTTTRTNNKTTRTRGTKQRNTPPTRNRNTKPEKQKGHKTEKPKKPKRKNETKNPHIKSIKKKKRYFSFFFFILMLLWVFGVVLRFGLQGLRFGPIKSFSGFGFLVLWWCGLWFLWSCRWLCFSIVVFGFSGVVCWSLASYCLVLSSPKRGVSSFVFVLVLVWCLFELLFGVCFYLFLIKL